MSKVYDLLVRAKGDTKGASRAVGSLERDVRKFGRGMTGLGKTLTASITAPIVALGAIGVHELMETRTATLKTDAVFKSMGDTVKVTKGEFYDMVKSLSNYSAIDGDVIQSNANIALSFGQLASNPKLFKDTMRASVDMSAALKTDVKTSVIALGKAMQNGAKGAAALGRNGTLTKNQIAKLNKMAKDGVPLWKQQEYILKAVNKQYKGAGKNADPLKTIGKAVKDLSESMATLLLPAILKASKYIQVLSDWIQGLSESQKKWVGGMLLIGAVVGPLLVVLGTLATAIAAIGIPIAAAIAAGMAFWGVLAGLYAKSGLLRGAVHLLFKVFKKTQGAVLALLFPVARLAVLFVLVYKAAKKLAEILAGAVRSAFNWIRDHAAKSWSAVKSAIHTTWSYASDLASKLAGAVRSGFNWIREHAAKAWAGVKGAMNAVKDYASSIGSSLTGNIRSGLEWVSSKAASKLAGFKSAAEKLRDVVVAIRDALASVIAKLSAAIKKAKQLGDKIPDVGGLFKSGGAGRAQQYAQSEPLAGGTHITVNVSGEIMNDPHAMAARLSWALRTRDIAGRMA